MSPVQKTRRVRCSWRATAAERSVFLPEADPLIGAVQVHRALTAPPLQRIGNFDLACATVAARRVPGDFVASFQHNGYCHVALGDLMGKGLSAAMWLTHVIDLFRRACEIDANLDEVMGVLNREMFQSRVCVPLTSLFLARIPADSPSISYSCAGCPPAFLLRSDHSVSLVQEGGPILGALQDSSYTQQTIQLGPKDTLVAVSDGIIEVHRGSDFELRPDRVTDYLKHSVGVPAIGVVDGLIKRIISVPEAPCDDFSILALQYVA